MTMGNNDSPETGAPEIEVTPAMIEAGAVILLDFRLESDEADFVRRIYQAMFAIWLFDRTGRHIPGYRQANTHSPIQIGFERRSLEQEAV